MPVFLLPIVVGGYYYLKNKKEEELAMAGESQDESSGTDLPRTPTSSAPATEECPSIEVSLVPSDSEKHPKQPHRGSPDDEEEVSIQPVKSQVLSRKESTDTAQTESSDEDIEQPAIGSNSRYGATTSSILSSSCVDCDQVAFFEIVECGNSSDCDNNISTSLRTIIEC